MWGVRVCAIARFLVLKCTLAKKYWLEKG
ncbi:unnamed protein product [Acanthoscelides obtectus]|uniref:Uncharacterized protein n=1 Tax=Acanthoscelides obtectus TaxID=200917 RepID=A0A9P0MAS3_ACAOB|nr:unnamed protein product [Acanthoscelides obtectus]CAH2015043.1 unnamed protein product [Acanthoscelides obtectus]CAK1623577.1 hypothetical protein AOBTE_LOCUS2081 [Acanthoscelides obtectus]CAK1623591.1 hypothetical protein AOBTE_LOCUS2088 [Acanthoscelides obtectus]